MSIPRNILSEAVYLTYLGVSSDKDYVNLKTDTFVRRACAIDNQPNNPHLKSEISEETVKNVAYEMLDIDCQKYLGIELRPYLNKKWC